jgi:uncharacterized membrane protein
VLNNVLTLWRSHGTKILGFAQVSIGAIAMYAEDFFGHHGAKIVLMVSGLLTAWRGFANSQKDE